MLPSQPALARYTRRLQLIASHLTAHAPAVQTTPASGAACATATATAHQYSTASMAAREVAVVGGGISGLYCASVLSRQGHKVTVFDMGKHAPGARSVALQERTVSLGPGPCAAVHRPRSRVQS
jgi:NADPH-dependent 2,4-dienoyl-CoA reductase/sulfur reductase-like enzyme